MKTTLDDDSRDVAARLTSAWLAHPNGNFVIVIVRVAPSSGAPSIRRLAARVVEVRGVVDGPAMTELLDGKMTELAAAIVVAAPRVTSPPIVLFSIDTSTAMAAPN